MKVSFFIGIMLLFSNSIYCQSWRDSLFLARDYYKQGDYQNALKIYNSITNTSPTGVDLSEEIGQTAYKSDSMNMAKNSYDSRLRHTTNRNDKARIYHNIGNINMKQNNYKEAIESYKNALRNNPYDEETRYNLSEAIRKLDKSKNDNKNKDQNENNNQNKDQKNKSNNKNDDSSKNKNDDPSNKKDDPNSRNNPSKNAGNEPDRSVERLLDQLNKKEAETKKKMGKKQNSGGITKSGKDW